MRQVKRKWQEQSRSLAKGGPRGRGKRSGAQVEDKLVGAAGVGPGFLLVCRRQMGWCSCECHMVSAHWPRQLTPPSYHVLGAHVCLHAPPPLCLQTDEQLAAKRAALTVPVAALAAQRQQQEQQHKQEEKQQQLAEPDELDALY